MAVTYDNELILAKTRLTNAATSRPAYVTYACRDQAGVANALTIANAVQDAFSDLLSNQLDTQVTIGPTDVLVGQGSTVALVATSNIANTTGNISADTIPANTAMLVKKVTGQSGRANRGRLYLPWSVGDVDVNEAGVITGGSVTGAQTRFTNWLARLVTDGYPMVIANRLYDLPWDNPDRELLEVNIGFNVSALVVESVCGTQRRRMRSN